MLKKSIRNQLKIQFYNKLIQMDYKNTTTQKILIRFKKSFGNKTIFVLNVFKRGWIK